MIDIGFSKLLLLGGIALVVIGPERLPRVARTVGTLLGRAQRYVAEVKAEVSRSIELEELNKMKQQFQDAASDVGRNLDEATRDVNDAMLGSEASSGDVPLGWSSEPPVPSYSRPRKNWRLRRGAMPQWYKRRHGVRTQVQSAAARVARYRPR